LRHPLSVVATKRVGDRAMRHADRRRYGRIIERYLTDCYGERTAARVSELAQLLDASRAYLSRRIPELFGKPLHDLLRDKQIEEAKRLLRTTPLRIDEVALASAFGTTSTFFRRFRTACGMTPDEYRERLKR